MFARARVLSFSSCVAMKLGHIVPPLTAVFLQSPVPEHFSANANGEAEVVKIILSPNCSAKKKELEFYFEELEIKNRGSIGNQVTKYPIKSIKFKDAGKSTLDAKKLWFDNKFGRLNSEEKGEYLGKFDAEDRLLVVYNDGNYEITDQELTQRFDVEKVIMIEKFRPEKIVTAVYLDNEKLQYNIKRFKIETTTLHTKFFFIKEGKDNRLEKVTTDLDPLLIVNTGRGQLVRSAKFKVKNMVEVMGWKAVGAKLTDFSKSVEMEWEKKEETDSPQTELF
jgi:topoisomerase-4 subunit A